MESTFRINANELDMDFINKIKTLFKGKNLEVVIQVQEEETDYLLKTKANKKHLLKAVSDINKNKNLKTLDISKLRELVK